MRGGRPRSNTSTVSVGDTIAGYVLKDSIGEGGMGRVFLAHDPRLDRFVALKLLPPGDADEEARARFLREARALARVEHPNVVAVHASGVDRDVAWMALEYIEGDPLDEILAAGPLDEETALLLAAQAARGLAAVHEVGVVHRDVKPGNLLLEDDGTLRVVDFGVAYFTEQNAGGGFVTQTGVAVGTPHFMAPEQARGGTVDGRADAWGLGATLFMMIAGKPPFMTDEDEADLDILAKVLRDAAPDLRKRAPGVSAETAAVVRRLLANKREDRLSDLEEIAALLEACADHLAGRGPMPVIEAAPAPEPSPAVAEPEPSPVATSSPMSRIGLLLGTALLLVFAVGVGWLLATNQATTGGVPNPRVERPPADPEPEQTTDLAPDDTPTPEPVAPTPLPSPDELALQEAEGLKARVLAGGDDGDDALARLLELQSAPARKAVLELAAMPDKASAVIGGIARSGARHHMRTLEWALLSSDTARGKAAAGALASLRSAEALELLRAAERSHADPAVRQAAKRARLSIFSIEGEGDDDKGETAEGAAAP